MILSHEFPSSLFMVRRLHLQSYFCDLSDVLPQVKAVSTFSFSKKHAGFFNDITTIMAPHLLFTLCVEHYIDCLGVEKAVNLDIFSYKKVNRSLWYLFFIVFFSLWVSNWFLSMSSDQQKLPSPIENTAAETPRLYFCDFVTSLYITIYRN